MSDDEKRAILRDVAEVVAGLQVPISMGMPLGAATEPWRRIKERIGFGWIDADEVEQALEGLLA